MTMPDFPSPEAAEAYKRAQAEIAKAKADGDSDLWLNGTDGFSALTHLPPDIADLEGLRILHLFQTQITDDGLWHIAGMEGLEVLNLSQTQITDGGLRHIAGMEGLRYLYLSHTQITDDGLRHIAGMGGLKYLNLSHTQITDDGLRHVAGMEGLGKLNLDQTQITDDGLRHIAGMEGLWNLSLSQTQITDDDLRHIAGMKGLKYLSLSQTQIGLPGLQHLARRDGLPRDARVDFRWLFFDGTPALRDNGLRAVYEGTKDATARTKTVLDYARDWVPPAPDDAPFAPRYHMDGAGPIRSDPVHPSDAAAELAALQQLTLQKATRLIDVLGPSNEYAWVKNAAEHYVAQMQNPTATLALQLIFAHMGTLLVAHQQHLQAKDSEHINDVLPPALAAALADMVRTHGLWWTNIPEAAAMDAQVAQYERGTNFDRISAQAEQITQSLDARPEVLAPEDHAAVAGQMHAAKGTTPAARTAEAGWVGRVFNIIGALGRGVNKAVSVAGARARDAIALGAVGIWAVSQKAVIIEFVKSVSPHSAAWIEWVFRALGA